MEKAAFEIVKAGKNATKVAWKTLQSFSRRSEKERKLVSHSLWVGDWQNQWRRFAVGETVDEAVNRLLTIRRRQGGEWNCGEWQVCKPVTGDGLGKIVRDYRLARHLGTSSLKSALDELMYEDPQFLEEYDRYLAWGGQLP